MSANQSDIDECYRLGANTYIEKPLDLDEFFSAIASFKDYWLNIALLPELDNR
jgi:two-component system response regulator